MQKWNELLLRYSFDKDAVFVLKKYSSCKIDGEWVTRRGMLTKYINSSYVGIDNYFVKLIFALACIGFIPSYDDFKFSMLNRKLPVRFRRENPIERLKSAYPSVPYDNVGINDNNWKLSHVVSANQNYPFPIDKILKQNFPKGNNCDWTLNNNDTYYARELNKEIKSEEVNALRIHFLRVCNPINHFLSPKKATHTYSFGKDIGEDKDLILYIKRRFMLRYGSSYNEYLREVKDDIFDDRSIEDIGNRVVNLKTVVSHEYPKNIPDQNDLKALKINETQMSTIKKTYKMTTEISQDQLYQMIALYINLGLSFRELEKRVLNIDSKERGGGFIAKSALNNMGVTASHKGKIRTKDQLTKACEIYNDSFGKTLKELLKLINKSASLDYYKIFI